MNITVQAYKRCEITLYSTKKYANPFTDVNIDAVFTHSDGQVIKIPGFWNGNDEWKVRFSSEKSGVWNYTVTCTDESNTSLTDSGKVEVSPCENPKTEIEKHGYVRLEEGKRHMVYGDGTPFFYLADTHWQMGDFEHLHDCNYPGCNCGSQFKHLVGDRLKKGFNVYQTYFWADRRGGTHSGTAPWWQEFYTLINPQPFNDVMDVMMEYLADKGMTIAMGFGLHNCTPKAYGSDPKPMLAFVRYCVARYACYPVVWITAQEITNLNDNAFAIWKMAGALVGELDGFKRPNGAHMHVHPYSDPRSQELEKEPWHQWWAVQGGHGGMKNLPTRKYYSAYRGNKKGQVIIETENQYEDIYCSGFCGHDAPRIGAWNAVFNGSAGFTYGVTGIWVLSYHYKTAPTLSGYSPEDWRSGMDKLGSSEVGFLKKFCEYIGWQDFVPEYGYKFGVFENRSKVSIFHKGNDTIVYMIYGERPEEGMLCDLKENTRYKASWYNTLTGNFIKIDDIVTEGDKAPIPPRPTMRDWVLLLTVEDLGHCDTEEYPHYCDPIPASAAHCGEEYKIVSIRATAEDEEHPATNLIDGNPDTYWKAYAPFTSQQITVDLGEAKELGYMHIECKMPHSRFMDFCVFASNDGERYDILVERPEKIVIGKNFERFFEPLRGKYRYVKFFMNSLELGAITYDTRKPVETPIEFTKFAIFAPGKEN